MVARGGIEPPTYRFSGGRSYQLSYLAARENLVEKGAASQRVSIPDPAGRVARDGPSPPLDQYLSGAGSDRFRAASYRCQINSTIWGSAPSGSVTSAAPPLMADSRARAANVPSASR